MARSKVWTPTAMVMWGGDTRPELRPQVDAILGVTLSDEAWRGFERVVYGYSHYLNHYFQGGDEKERDRLLAQARDAGATLEATADKLETWEMGRAMSNLIDDAWAQEFDQEGIWVRDHDASEAELASVVGEEMAEKLFGTWAGRGLLSRPWPAMDFLSQLRVFNAAIKRAIRNLENDEAPKPRHPFDDLVAMLCVWKDENGIEAGATKLSDYDNFGRLTYLTKLILHEVPELRNRDGELEAQQIRFHTEVTDATLATYVIKARARHYASMKQLGKEIGPKA